MVENIEVKVTINVPRNTEVVPRQVLSRKRRNWISAVMCENEKVIHLKKRKTFLSSNQEEAMQVREGEREEGEEDIHEIQANGREDTIDMATAVQVSNPISLLAIAASWLADSNVGNQESTIPEAYFVRDAPRKDDSPVVQEATGNNFDEAIVAYEGETGQEREAEGTDVIVASDRKQLFVTKPRSRIQRRPRAYYAPMLTHADTSAEVVVPLDVSAPLNVSAKLVLIPLRRRSRGLIASAAISSSQGSRCTRMNGRGWRCKEVPNFGYALCEHHLGKRVGRPKGNLGSTPGPKKKPGKAKLWSIASQRKASWKKEEGVGGEAPSIAAGPKKQERKMGTEEKMWMGTVKTRSLKSILKNSVVISKM